MKKLLHTGIAAIAALTFFGCSPNYAKWRPLEEKILEQSRNNQTVMFGEDHFFERDDNDFVKRLLPKLKEQGFKYFAIEIDRYPQDYTTKELYAYATGKMSRKELDTGTKITEYIYGQGWFDLIDEARNLGFKVVPYDANHLEYDNTNEREEVSYSHVKELIFDKDPNARVVFFCGAFHANEKPIKDKKLEKWEKKQGMFNEDEDVKYKFIGSYLEEYTKGHNLTISLIGDDYNIKETDLELDLDDYTFKIKSED